MTTMTNIQEAAADMRARFILKTRASDDSRYWTHDLEDERARDLALSAHDDGAQLPNDWRYQFIVDALDILAEYEDEDDYTEALDSDTDTQWSTLADWIQSSPARGGYVDDAIREFGYPTDRGIWNAIAIGQLQERTEVLYAVKSWLESNG